MRHSKRKLDDGRGGTVSASILLPDDYAAGSTPVLVLAHGAGAGMEHPFMSAMQRRFAERGSAAVLFNFPYKERGARAPDKGNVLEECYRAVVEQLGGDAELEPGRLILGGKSMGGRIATQVVARGCEADGILLLGYPLHPPGKRDRPRREHLLQLDLPLLFVQGTRDSLCNLDDLRVVLDEMKAPTELHVVEGGDHSFKVPKKSGRSEDEILDEIAGRGARWIETAVG